MALVRWVGRAIGLDVHRDFCVVAICEDGKVRSAGRVPSTPEGLRLLAESLLATDRVALEVTASCWEVARILEPFVDRVIVVSPDDTGIASARAKTDKLDARALAVLCWKGEIDAVWMPDERCRILRRRLARREQLVHARSRSKNEISAVLQRRLIERPAVRGPVRRDGPPVAGRGAAARRGARIGRRGAAADRVPGRRDQGGREADRPAGAGLAGDPPVDDRPGREPDLRRDVHRRDRPGRPVPHPAASSSRISGWTRRSASPARHPPGRAGSPSAGRRPRGGRWSRRPGAWSSSPARCARSTNASVLGVGTARRSSRRPASSRSCSGACSNAARTTRTSARR